MKSGRAIQERLESVMSKIIDSPEEATKILIRGGVGIFPTDTAFGVGCRMDREDSVKRIYELRNRPREKALIALVSSVDMAREYALVDERTEKIMNRYWPGGLTIILKNKKEKVPSIVSANGETLAIRMPNHHDLLSIITSVGVPIVAPSANIAGEHTPLSFDELNEELFEGVDFILRGVCTIKGVSTIVDATTDTVKVVRRGVVDFL